MKKKYRGWEMHVWVYSALQRVWNTDEVWKLLLPPQWRCSTGGQGVVGSERVCGELESQHANQSHVWLPEGLLSEQLPHTNRQLHMRRKEKSLNMIVYLCIYMRERARETERNFDLNIHTQTASSSVSVQLFVVTHWKWRNVRNLQGVRECTIRHSPTPQIYSTTVIHTSFHSLLFILLC